MTFVVLLSTKRPNGPSSTVSFTLKIEVLTPLIIFLEFPSTIPVETPTSFSSYGNSNVPSTARSPLTSSL